MEHIIKSTILALSLGCASVFGFSTPAHADIFDFTVKPPLVPFGYKYEKTIGNMNMYCNYEGYLCFSYGEAKVTSEVARNKNAREIYEALKHIYNGSLSCSVNDSSLTCTRDDVKSSQFLKFKYSSYKKKVKVVVVYIDHQESKAIAKIVANQIL